MDPNEEIEADEDDDQEEEEDQYLDQIQAQSQLDSFRSWLEEKEYERASELEALKSIIEAIASKLRKIGFWNETLDSGETSTLRAYLDIQRRMRDLIREERDDLKWLWELEHREYILERQANKPEPQEEHRKNRRPNRQQSNRPRANEKPKWNFKKPKAKS